MSTPGKTLAGWRQAANRFALGCSLSATLTALVLAPAQAAGRVGIAAGVAGVVQVSEGDRIAPAPVNSGMDMLMRDRVQSDMAARMRAGDGRVGRT